VNQGSIPWASQLIEGKRMEALMVLGWAVWIVVSIALVYDFVGYSGLVSMFPEGRRWWHLPAQFLALGLFAAAVICHPF